MARVTIEDCALNIPNKFELVLVAANRSKKLSRGIAPILKRDNDKNPVLALREIAHDAELSKELQNNLITSLQKVHVDTDTHYPEESPLDSEKDWSEQIAQLSRELESLGLLEEDLAGHLSIEENEISDNIDDDTDDVLDIDVDEK